MGKHKKPLVALYDYQKAWLEDSSRYKIGMFSRQTGKTFVCTMEIVKQVLEAAAKEERCNWLIVSASERQSIHALKVAKQHFRALDSIFQKQNKAWLEDIVENKHEIVLPNGSTITSLPANPATIRGYSCNVYADEFAFHEDSAELWKALFPVASNNYRLLITSTPNGKTNVFYKLFTEEKNGWSKHRIDIYQAVEQGLQRNIAKTKDELNDAEAWAQEYELQWLDEATSWLPYEMIQSCEGCDPGDTVPCAKSAYYIGIDIGRRKDLFVLWVLEKRGDVFYERQLVAEKGINFAAQEDFLRKAIATYKPQRVCIDQTGMGEQFTERAKETYGSYTVEGILFSNNIKLDLANGLRRHFEERSIRIHAGDKTLRDDLHSLRRTTTKAGNIRFVAERNNEGHADRAWALALALHAGQEMHQPFEYESIEKDPWSAGNMMPAWDW